MNRSHVRGPAAPHPRARRAAAVLTAALATALALVAHSTSAASITPEARKVLDRYARAVGGLDALLAESATHAKGSLAAFGLSGSFESWSQRPDKSANVTTIGPFTIREGFDGVTAWRVDQNGKLTIRDGKDLDDARASAWFENDLWLTPDHGGGSITRVGAERDSAGAYEVLEITPPVGRSRRLWFSTRTGLLDRVVAKQDQRTVVNRLSDWTPVAGRPRPRLTTIEIQDMPMNNARITLDSLWVNPALDPGRFSLPDRGVADAQFLGGKAPARLPFRYDVRHVWLQASVNGGPPEDFLLDTGASITVLDSAYAARRGIATQGAIQVAGAGASGGASFAQLDSIRVESAGQGVLLMGQKVAVVSLNPYVEPFFWRPLAGVLGYDFISRFVLEVDYDQAALTLHDPKRFEYRGSGTAIPMTMAGNIPVVKARIDDRYEGEFRLDVGSGSTVDLHAPFVAKNELLGRAGKTYEVLGGGFGGTYTSRIGRMRKMEIGPFSWSDPIVVLSGANTGALASEDYAGNIGNHVLERFRCTFDYERRMVHLEPARRFRSRDVFTRSGFQLAREGDRLHAMQVLPGSAADQAGVKPGDEVVSVDGKPALGFGAEGLRRMFEDGAPGDRHALVLARETTDGKGRTTRKTIKTRIVLADVL